jgi:chaperonin GroEL (HSP60 family)
MVLFRAAKELRPSTPEQILVADVIRKPFYQILANAEENLDILEARDPQSIAPLNETKGYNVITRQWEDLFESGIIDPAKVVKCAIRNAFAMGNQILTAQASIIDK